MSDLEKISNASQEIAMSDDANLVMACLRQFRDEVDGISARVCGKRNINQEEKEQLRIDIAALSLHDGRGNILKVRHASKNNIQNQ